MTQNFSNVFFVFQTNGGNVSKKFCTGYPKNVPFYYLFNVIIKCKILMLLLVINKIKFSDIYTLFCLKKKKLKCLEYL